MHVWFGRHRVKLVIRSGRDVATGGLRDFVFSLGQVTCVWSLLSQGSSTLGLVKDLS